MRAKAYLGARFKSGNTTKPKGQNAMTTRTLYRGQVDSPDHPEVGIGQFWTDDMVAAMHYGTSEHRNDRNLGWLLTMTVSISITETAEHVLCDGPEECNKHIGDADALMGPDSIMGAVSEIDGYYIPRIDEFSAEIKVQRCERTSGEDEYGNNRLVYLLDGEEVDTYC